MSRQASFAEKVSGAMNCYDGFLPVFRDDADLALPCAHVEDRVARIALSKHSFVCPVFELTAAAIYRREKRVQIKGLFWHHDDCLTEAHPVCTTLGRPRGAALCSPLLP